MLLSTDKEIDIFIASRIGSFKHIRYHTESSKNTKKCIENLVDIKSLQKDDTITCMVWGNQDQDEILIGKKNQQIQVYNTQKSDVTKSYTADFGTGDIVGLGRYKRKIIAALSSGVVKIWSKKGEEIINTGGKLDRLQVCKQDNTLLATGGEENDLKVWQIGTPEAIFSAKNLPHDWLQLRRPVWVSDLTFLDVNTLAVCSRHGYVRLYDTRAQRRPVVNVDFEAKAATCLCPGFEERQVVVGFGRGQLHQVDLRNSRPDKGYKGAVGAVTDIGLIPSERQIVSTSLDRYVRVHDQVSKNLVYKQYLTSKLSRLLIQTETSTPLRGEEEIKAEEEIELQERVGEVTVADDLDELFDNMETVGEKRSKKKPKESESEAKKIKPSLEGDTENDVESDPETAIMKLLKSTEKQKRKMARKRRDKKSKSVFHNA